MSEENGAIIWCGVWFMSLLLGLVMLTVFWKDRVSRLASLYALKPSILVILQSFTLSIAHRFIYGYSYPRISAWTNIGYDPLESIVTVSMDIFVTYVIVYLFLDLHNNGFNIAVQLIIIDILRWLIFVIIEIPTYFNQVQFPDYYYMSKLIIYFFFQISFAFFLGLVRNKKRFG